MKRITLRNKFYLMYFTFTLLFVMCMKTTAAAATKIIPINVNTNVSGTIESEATFYSFTTSANGYFTYSVTQNNPSSNGKIYVELRDSDNNVIEDNSAIKYNSITWPCKAGTTYYIAVSNSLLAKGQDYTLRVNQTAEANWEQEPNNSQATATSLSWNTAMRGVIAPNDQDFYKIKITQPGYFTLSLKHHDISESGKWTVNVMQENGTVIYSESGNNITSYYLAENVGSTIYVSVKNDILARYELYDLKLTYTVNKYFESENNDSAQTADPINFNTAYQGLLNSQNDDGDWYSFNNPSDGVVTLTFGPTDVASTGKRDVFIVDAKGASSCVYCDNSTKTIPIKLKKGKYYIKVQNNLSGRDSLYTLKITQKALNLTGKNTIKNVKAKKIASYLSQMNATITMKKYDKSAQYFEVKISKNKKMKKATKYEVDKGKKVSVKHKYKKGTYYAQVRPYISDQFGNKWYGKKSNIVKFKVK